MKCTNKRGWRVLVLAGLALAAASVGSRVAHAEADAAKAQVSEVIVTGRVARSDVTSVTPITSINADQLSRSSTTTLEQMFQTLPALGFQGVNGANAGGFGVYFVDLRSLNFNRTLTLVDDYRFVVSGIKTDEAVDLNNVPLALIDHIDILRSGSEPVFGPDAVAGVVNVVLKRNFDGTLLTAYGGAAVHGGDGTGEISATWGHNFERGNLTINAGYFRRDAISQSSRPFSARPVTSAVYGPDGSIQSVIGIPATPGGHAVSADGAIDDVFFGPTSAEFRPFDETVDSYNFAKGQDLQGSLGRATANLFGYYDITPKLTASIEAMFSDRQSDFTQAPQVLGLTATQKNPDGFVVPVGAGGNPFGEPVALERVMNEVGPLKTNANGYTYRILAKLTGEFGRFTWEAALDRGESYTTYKVRNSVNLTKALELASCADPSCQSADFFGVGSLSPAAADYMRYTDVSHSDYTETIGQGWIQTELAKLPGGPLTAKLGGEVRWETGYTHMDPVVLAGDQAAPDSANTNGAYNSQEIYLALTWPLLADRPWAKSLNLETAVRYSHFDQFGGYPTWKVAGSWAPTEDIRFRGAVGLARRQPAITEAFAGLSATPAVVQDPCDSVSGERSNPVVDANCLSQGLSPNFTQASPLVNLASGGQPHLTPEASTNFTIGGVITPRFAPGLSIAADYYKYDIENAIDSLADTEANFIPDTCYESENLSNPLCGLIERTASGPNKGQINRIVALDANLGAIITDGLDFDISYQHAFTPGIRLNINWQSNYLLNFIVKEEGETTQYAGSFASLVNVGTYAHFKSLLATTLQVDGWTFGMRNRYIGGANVLDQDPGTPYFKAPATWYHDLVVSYSRGPITYTLGADNITDQRPPFLVDGMSNTDLNTYDIDGTFVYFRIAARL